MISSIPRWIRGQGGEREGWCPFCSRWRKLKNSTFWYDKTFGHGINRLTGWFFDGPAEVRRVNYDVSGSIAAVSSPMQAMSPGSPQDWAATKDVQNLQGKCRQCGLWVEGLLYAARRANRSPEITTNWSRQWLDHASKVGLLSCFLLSSLGVVSDPGEIMHRF